MLVLNRILIRISSHPLIRVQCRKCANGACASSVETELDTDYLCDPKFTEEIRTNIRSRKGVGDIDKVLRLYSALKTATDKDVIKKELHEELLKIPNRSHSSLWTNGTEPQVVDVVGRKKEFTYKARPFHELAELIDGLRTKNLGLFTGTRSYYLKGPLASLEDALVKMTLDVLLKKKNFQLVSVPDLLPSDIIKKCGMNVDGERTQVYKLNRHHYGDVCLSGTSEMALAGMFANEAIDKQLPVKLAAVSRCYRAEISNVQEEKGIFRVHQFTKVEMFGLTRGDCNDSEQLLEEFVSIQKELFSALGLHFKQLDMPMHELGAPAYRKFDIEAWMAGREIYGEISSASNCTDYQSRRLGIRYKCMTKDGRLSLPHVHTVNGTACAVPRMLIALLETHQREDGTVDIPKILEPYLLTQNSFQQPPPKMKMKLIKEFPTIDCQ